MPTRSATSRARSSAERQAGGTKRSRETASPYSRGHRQPLEQLLLRPLVEDLQEVADRHRGEDRADEAGGAGHNGQAREQRGRDPLGHAERADEQLADRLTHASPAGALLDLAGAALLLELGERGTKWRGHPVLGDDPAQLVRGDADEQQVTDTDVLG